MLRRAFLAALAGGVAVRTAAGQEEQDDSRAAGSFPAPESGKRSNGGSCQGPCTLLTVRRIYVEELSGGETAGQIRDMIIAGFQKTGLFLLTENPDRADAILRGSAEDLIFNETHESRDGIDARGSVSVGSSTRSGGGRSRRDGGLSVNTSLGEDQFSRSVERRHEATAAVRLVNRDGDVIWSTVQESRGAKFRGASADVADKITQRLVQDHKRAKLRAEDPTGRAHPAEQP